MPNELRSELNGYVYFDDPNWWRHFAVTEQCARHTENFRHAVMALEPWNGEEPDTYDVTIDQLWVLSEGVINHMQWHAKRDIAVIVALAQLYEECAERITPMNIHTGFVQSNLKMKAQSIRSLLSTMHDVHCCKDANR